MQMNTKIYTLHLFPVLDKMLIELLQSLTEEEWNVQTVAKLWKVKDVASHLLDGNLRALSISRDSYYGEKPENIHSYQDLVDFLNNLNMTWTHATKRLSPKILTSLLDLTGQQYIEHLRSLDPFEDAIFPVAWAGQVSSPNWFHIAREYTEKFLHQQQIRDAVGKQGLLVNELYHPFIDTFMYAFPYTFRKVESNVGTVVSMIVTTEIGGEWQIIKGENDWSLSDHLNNKANAVVKIDPDTAWKLFSKSWNADQVIDKVEINGDRSLGLQALKMVSVMA